MSLVEPTDPVPVEHLGRVHLVGVGGAGMSGIARILLQRGVAVSGSDARDSDTLRSLEDLGAKVHIGHAAENLGDVETLVVSSAIRVDNPELVEARRRGIRILPRAAALGALLLGRRGVAVAGTHGKTTTTCMLTAVLQHVEADPGYVIGGQLVTTGVGADAGADDVIVVEADESDGSFLMLAPSLAVVTNVEADHLDNYGGLDEIHDKFAAFVDRVAGALIVGIDDPGARRVAEIARERGHPVRTFGESPRADYRVSAITAEGFTTAFTLTPPEGEALSCTLALPGRHNALNAAAAIAVADELGYDPEVAVPGLTTFTGAARRFELKGAARGVRVYDSYAHHPTEIEADLRAARAALDSTPTGQRAGTDTTAPATPGRVLAMFQPHLYSRTRIFAAEFAEALTLADEVLLLPIYAAREDPEPGVTTDLIAERIGHKRVHPHTEAAAAVAQAATLAREGDIILTMGAGDITELGPRIVAALEVTAD
ncbi:UDP-N-acetylmuramate--L-alanine ligase [Salinactinospora qingdaonensis]|uniref:UDP-N-acetylmuramate--L-alanine ligase n=1 Tax=Salinactinospora qingdaonensis TaxID=702744 RepID=A0ABP7FSD1_9ACTN